MTEILIDVFSDLASCILLASLDNTAIRLCLRIPRRLRINSKSERGAHRELHSTRLPNEDFNRWLGLRQQNYR